jgi:hypothetical protein
MVKGADDGLGNSVLCSGILQLQLDRAGYQALITCNIALHHLAHINCQISSK